MKPLFGIITDSIPFYGYRRKSYLITFGLLSFLCWNTLAFCITNKTTGILVILLTQFCVAFNNVIGGNFYIYYIYRGPSG